MKIWTPPRQGLYLNLKCPYILMALNLFFLPRKVLSLPCHEFSNVHKDFFLNKKLGLTCRNLCTKFNSCDFQPISAEKVWHKRIFYILKRSFWEQESKILWLLSKITKTLNEGMQCNKIEENCAKKMRIRMFYAAERKPFFTFSSKTIKVV